MRHYDIEELALYAAGLSEEEITKTINGESDTDSDTVVYEKFDVDMEQFSQIAEALLMLTPVMKSPLTSELSHNFVRSVEGGYISILKTKTDK